MKMNRNIVAALLPLLLLAASPTTPRSHAQAPAPAAAAAGAPAEAPKIDPLELKAVPNFTLADDPAELTKQVGKIVRLRFGYRTSRPGGVKDGKTIVQVVYEYTKYAESKAEAATLLVPPEGAKWLATVPIRPKRNGSEYVYVRVIANRMFDVLGTEIKTTSKGPELVW